MQKTNWSRTFATSPGYVDAKGGRRESVMSHDIRRVMPLRRRKSQKMPAKSKQIDQVKRKHFDDFIQTFGTPFASGGYGKLFRVEFSNDMRRQLGYFLSEKGSIIKLPGRLTKVAIKLQYHDPEDSFTETVTSWNQETEAHDALQHLDCVPNLYAAGRIGDVHITVMQYVDGTPLFAVPKSKDVYEKVEACFVQIWLAGWSHGDAHGGNILIANNGTRVYVIDFGMSVKLPERIRRDVKKAINEGQEAVHVYEALIQPYVDRSKRGEGFPWFNPNGKALKVYRQEAKWLAIKELQARYSTTSPSNMSTSTMVNSASPMSFSPSRSYSP